MQKWLSFNDKKKVLLLWKTRKDLWEISFLFLHKAGWQCSLVSVMTDTRCLRETAFFYNCQWSPHQTLHKLLYWLVVLICFSKKHTYSHWKCSNYAHTTGENPSLYLPLVPEASTHGQKHRGLMTINGFATCTDMLFSLLVTLAEELKDWDLKSKYIPALNIGTCDKTVEAF